MTSNVFVRVAPGWTLPRRTLSAPDQPSGRSTERVTPESRVVLGAVSLTVIVLDPPGTTVKVDADTSSFVPSGRPWGVGSTAPCNIVAEDDAAAVRSPRVNGTRESIWVM